MNNPYAAVIRFIDLGLLLLMAFLAVADLHPTFQAPLPGPTAQEGTQMRTFQVRFDGEMEATVQRLPRPALVCRAGALEELGACLRSLGEEPSRFLLTPIGDATVQQLVDIMDVCAEEGLPCSVAK